ncbi:hypothetical protein NCC49_004482 [Naganishia albida]|nr:hypothetical protein NCC49_004482 [Naganishia albida]
MRFATFLFTLLAAQVHAADSDDVTISPTLNETYFGELLDILNDANFTALASAFNSISNTTAGSEFLAWLPLFGDQRVLLAPVNDAFASVPEEVSGNATLMANTLAYHVAFNLDPKELTKSPEHDFFKTFYKNPQIGDLRAQLVVSLVNDTNGQERIGIPHQNGGMAYADVLALPLSLERITKAYAPAFTDAVTQAGLMDFFSLRIPEMTAGMTLFVPDDAAWKNAEGSWLSGLSSVQYRAVLANHLTKELDFYTDAFRQRKPKVRSEAGYDLTMLHNGTGYYVTSTNSTSNLTTAKLTETDITFANGVMHIIDRVLLPNQVENVESSAVDARLSPIGTAGGVLAMAAGILTSMVVM